MAIGTVSSAQVAATKPVAGHGFAGNLKVAYGTYDIAAAPADGDIIQMCRTPKGAIVIGGWVIGEDIDTGTEVLDFDAGYAANGSDAADPDAWGNFGAITGDVSVHMAVAGIYLPFQGVLQADGPKTLAAETVHQIEFNVAANAGGTGRLTMVVLYVLP